MALGGGGGGGGGDMSYILVVWEHWEVGLCCAGGDNFFRLMLGDFGRDVSVCREGCECV